MWNEVAQDQVVAHEASLEAATAMFAAPDLTLADSAIGLYDAKYAYRVWRPITAIMDGAEFGFPPDPGWNPLTTTPPGPPLGLRLGPIHRASASTGEVPDPPGDA